MVLQPHSHAFHVFDSCGILLRVFLSVFFHWGHSFSHSMNTHEPQMRFLLSDEFLNSFSCGVMTNSWAFF
jgi:hypothetical protein